MLQRTQISLSDEDRAILDAEAARTGKSISALIRDAIAEVYGDKRNLAADLAAMDQAFGAWKDRDEDGYAYVERMRPGTRFREPYGDE